MNKEILFFNNLIELKQEINKRKEVINNSYNQIVMELDIAIRVWHNIQEDYLRNKIELLVSELDFLKSLDWVFEKYKKELNKEDEKND